MQSTAGTSALKKVSFILNSHPAGILVAFPS